MNSKFFRLFLVILACTLLLSGSRANAGEKPELIYIYDPLCSWCFGFSPVIERIKAQYDTVCNFTIMTGGLVVGGEKRPVKISEDVLKGSLENIEEVSGVSFGESFFSLMQSGTYFYDSETPCHAQYIIKDFYPQLSFEFGKRLQTAFFTEGKNLNDSTVYTDLLNQLNIDNSLFMKKFRDAEYRDLVFGEFEKVTDLGIQSYPAVILKVGNKIKILSNGYISYEKLNKILSKELKK